MDAINERWRELAQEGYCIDLGDSWGSRCDTKIWAVTQPQKVRPHVPTFQASPTAGVEIRPVSRTHMVLVIEEGEHKCRLVEYRDYQLVQEL